jgi:hypothetical protein
MQEVVNAKSVVYYGLDFSKIVLTDPQKYGKDQELMKFFPAWIDDFHKEIVPDIHIKRWLHKGDNFKTELTSVQERFKLVSNSWISFDNHSFGIDTLQEIIHSYQINENEGIGFVIVLENFNKIGEYITAYFTFFNIGSKEILWATKVRGKPGGFGMSAYWAAGIRDATKLYMNKVYFKSVN